MSDGRTDERLDSPPKKKRDMDSRFLAGCLTIAVLSIVFWTVASWPFFVFPVHTRAGLASTLWFGALPALVLGGLLTRRMGLEAGTAFIGGSLAAGVFAFLHLGNLSLGAYADVEGMPAPDYPSSWVWLIPLAWCFAVGSVVFLLLPKRETEDEARPGGSRQ